MVDSPEKTPRDVVIFGAIISVLSVSLAIVHLIWPDLRIDAVTLALLVVAVVPWLGRIFARVELPGGWKLEYREFKRSVERELTEKQQQVRELSQRIDRVEQFVVTGDTNADREGRLRSALDAFQQYLAGLGYRGEAPLPRIHIGPLDDPEIRGVYSDDNAFFHGSRNLIVVGRSLADDPAVLLREYSHHILHELAPGTVEDWTGGGLWDAASIHSALADYFPCSFQDDPCFARASAAVWRSLGVLGPGDRCLRDLSRVVQASSVTGDRQNPQQAGWVWASAFWEIRGHVGAATLDPALLDAWRHYPVTATPQAAAATLLDRLGADFPPATHAFASRGLAV
ncbi:hypothetical protein GCM10010168_17330 [Actinoplanes ianthinogenes]|uniref:Uncharacterized protein n=1 Tax=Actinoplanes ianthinogenes TaxID=122358 RepID=A0ABN6CQE7_9ACTN|nr:hypothetical protein [Actinoplanes ianthinogenes]BCJ47375.1 hypothetical protein Aiant_80320 [Actinoplanes ianthinogenes]GGR01388.1 hypothetical protein GCM10010168_17330 [Actinoplanes ianthinogenes]